MRKQFPSALYVAMGAVGFLLLVYAPAYQACCLPDPNREAGNGGPIAVRAGTGQLLRHIVMETVL
ncbi:MAG: hypothetical protein ACJ74Z_10855 [Bryobacteraceae bacterium]